MDNMCHGLCASLTRLLKLHRAPGSALQISKHCMPLELPSPWLVRLFLESCAHQVDRENSQGVFDRIVALLGYRINRHANTCLLEFYLQIAMLLN